ncbi:hypothetical protein LINPERPRIM_LOCUS14016 [Linum perenne]
MAELVPQLQST